VGEVSVGHPEWRPSEAVFVFSKRDATAAQTGNPSVVERVSHPGMSQWHPVTHPLVVQVHWTVGTGTPAVIFSGTAIATGAGMLKLLGSYVIARMLGFGLVGALVIYLLWSLLS
jgi:hypothetical protein